MNATAFRDIKVGDAIPDWLMESVRPERMRTMAAILRDPNPVHWDREACAKIGFGHRTINQGPLGLSYMVNMLHAWAGPGCVGLDTGAGKGGFLTALELPARVVYESR